MIVFANGNYYKLSQTYLHQINNGFWYMGGFRWMKSKKKWSGNALMHCFGLVKPEILTDDEAKAQGLM